MASRLCCGHGDREVQVIWVGDTDKTRLPGECCIQIVKSGEIVLFLHGAALFYLHLVGEQRGLPQDAIRGDFGLVAEQSAQVAEVALAY